METKIKWMYDGHREAMKQAVSQTRAINKAGNLDREYAAALYLLTGMEDVWFRIEKYVNMDGIDYEEILYRPLSIGERIVVELSMNLFSGSICIKFTPIDLVGCLDDYMFELAINGIILRRGRSTVAMLEE